MENEGTSLATLVSQEMELEIPPTTSMEQIKAILVPYIAQLIDHNFEKLVFLLYRIDVNENKMRTLLHQQEGQDTPELIADLIIERQLQKIQTRKEFKQGNDDSNEERW